jgi:hypothetical protein
MIHLLPPYRLETIADVRAFLRPRPDEYERALLNFAKRSAQDIKKPPILELLPSKFDIELREVNTSVRWIVNDINDIDLSNELHETINLIRSEQQHFLTAVKDLQNDYFQLFRRIIEEGTGLAGIKKTGISPSESDGAPPNITNGLKDQSDAFSLLVAVLRRYLNTKQKSLLDFLKRSIARLCSFTPSDHNLDQAMIERFRRLPPSSSLIVNDLHTLYVERLERLKRNMFLPHAHHFRSFTKNKLTRLPISSHIKRNIIDVLNGVEQVKDIEKAKKMHFLKMYEERMDPEEMLRLTNILSNFYEKLYSFDGFFQKICSSARIMDLYTLFCEEMRTIVDVESITAKVVFTLYPCKDMHDFLKGVYSCDCSCESGLAMAHLLNPKFFNIRIFQNEKWIGCIYMLDFTDRGVLLMDRIQIGDKQAFILINFFPSFIKQFASFMNVRNDLRILAPSAISNFRVIQQSFDHYAKGLPKISFPLSANDRMFDSARQRSFNVIHGAVPLATLAE